MTDDKILFLSFPFIAGFRLPFVKKKYNMLLKRLKIENAESFEYIIDWFRDDKIDVSENTIWFSHPSYSAALEYILLKDKKASRIK